MITAMVALTLVVTAFIAPASARTLNFRFSGDAADFINYSTNPSYFDCFSGWLRPSGNTINSGLTACVSPGFDVSPTPDELSVSVFADVARWTLSGTHSSTVGYSVANAEVFGELDNGGDGVVVRLDKTKFDSDTKKTVTTFGPAILQSLDVNETATAKCQKSGNHGKASASATVSFDHLKVVHGGVDYELAGGVFGDANFDVVANAAGAANQSIQIVRSFRFDHTDYVLIVVTNDYHKWVNGNESAITGNGLHVILQTEDGQIAADLVIAHAHADIECAFSLHSFTDPFGL